MPKMTTVIIGGLLLLGGILLYLGVHLAAVLYMSQIDAWPQPPAHYMTALTDSGGYPMFWVSIVLIILGLLLLGAKLFEKLGLAGQSGLNEIRRQDRIFDARRAQSEAKTSDRNAE